MREVDSDWLKGHAIHNGLFDLIISNYVVYVQVVHAPKAIKYILLKINYLFTIYVQFIWLANVVFLKKKRIIGNAQVIILVNTGVMLKM